ncbi:MAG: methyltransferase [Candidatus Hydrogenedentota bacterium]
MTQDFKQFAQRLDELASGYTRAQILFTANNAALFDYLETPASAEAVAQKLGWSPRGTRMLLDGLVGLGLVEKRDSAYSNAPIASHCLVSSSEGYQGHILQHKAHGWEAWSRLDEAVAQGAPPPEGRSERNEHELRAFILGMDDGGRLSARDMLERIDLTPYRHMLDIGGGPGSYPIAFLQRHPHMRATLLDQPKVVEIAREQVAKAQLEDRIGFIEGDFLETDFGDGYDLVLLSNIIHMLDAGANARLVQRCADAMAPGGLLIVKDFIVDDARTGPPFSLFFALNMLLHTDGGDTYRESDVMEWTRAAGFDDGRFVDLTPQTRLWLVHKP